MPFLPGPVLPGFHGCLARLPSFHPCLSLPSTLSLIPALYLCSLSRTLSLSLPLSASSAFSVHSSPPPQCYLHLCRSRLWHSVVSRHQAERNIKCFHFYISYLSLCLQI